MTNVEMKTTLCGVTMKNPIIAASGTFGFGREMSLMMDLSLLGGISCKGITLTPREGNPPPRIAETPSGILNSVGLQNPGVDWFIQKELPWIKKHDVAVIANIAGNTVEDYVAMAEKLNQTAVDMIEMNISCPNVKCGGAAFGTSAETIEHITSEVKSKCPDKPLMVKLTPNVTSIADMAAAAEAGGADAISLINTLLGMRIDVKTRRPILHNNVGGLSGPAVFPVAVRMVWEVYQRVKLPIVGLGGVMTGENAAELMMAGATAVQVGTATLRDPYAAPRIAYELKEFAAKQGLTSIGQLTGSVQAYA